MANQIVSVHTGIYGMGIYTIMLPSSGFSVAHYTSAAPRQLHTDYNEQVYNDHTRQFISSLIS